MDIAKLLLALFFGVDVEVVVALLPEGALLALHGDGDFQCLDSLRQTTSRWFTDQQVYVLRHDDVAGDEEAIPHPHLLQRTFKERTRGSRSEVWLSLITGKCHEVEIACLLKRTGFFFRMAHSTSGRLE